MSMTPARRGDLSGGTRSKRPGAWPGKEATTMTSGVNTGSFQNAFGPHGRMEGKGGVAYDLIRE